MTWEYWFRPKQQILSVFQRNKMYDAIVIFLGNQISMQESKMLVKEWKKNDERWDDFSMNILNN